MADEYIRRQGAIIQLSHNKSRGDDEWELAVASDMEIIRTMSSADVVQVVHAYWIDTENYYRRWRCSACSGHTKEAHPPFCPFCGAKMDARREE